MIKNAYKHIKKVYTMSGLSNPLTYDSSEGPVSINGIIEYSLEKELYYINKESSEIEELITKKYNPKNKDKLYFHKSATVPRYKVREWAKKEGASVTIKQDKANAVFVNEEKLLNSITKYYHKNGITLERLKQFLFANYPVDSIQNILDFFDKTQPEVIYLNYQMFNIICKSSYNANSYIGIKRIELDESERYHRSKGFISEKNYEELGELLNKDNIYSENDIIELINKDLAVIDDKMMETVENMYKSTDSDNWKIATEIITNCNIQESMFNVLMILKKHNHRIKNISSRNHVGFKSMMKYLDLTLDSCAYNDNIIRTLMTHETLTVDNLMLFLEGVKKDARVPSRFFKVASLDVSDEIKAYFNPEKYANKEEEDGNKE